MAWVGWALTFIGFAITIGAALHAWRLDPNSPRYQTGLFNDDGSGTRNVIRDQGRVAAITATGASLQLLGAVLVFTSS